MQRGIAILVPCFNVCAILEKNLIKHGKINIERQNDKDSLLLMLYLHDIRMIVVNGKMERCLTVISYGIDFCAFFDKDLSE